MKEENEVIQVSEHLERVKADVFRLYIGKPLFLYQGTAKSASDCPYEPGEQGIFLDGVIGTQIVMRYIAEQKKDLFNQSTLFLRTPSSMTTIEALQVAKVAFPMFNHADHTGDDAEHLVRLAKDILNQGSFSSKTFLKLISMGICVRYYEPEMDHVFHPVDLVQWGIVTLHFSHITETKGGFKVRNVRTVKTPEKTAFWLKPQIFAGEILIDGKYEYTTWNEDGVPPNSTVPHYNLEKRFLII